MFPELKWHLETHVSSILALDQSMPPHSPRWLPELQPSGLDSKQMLEGTGEHHSFQGHFLLPRSCMQDFPLHAIDQNLVTWPHLAENKLGNRGPFSSRRLCAPANILLLTNSGGKSYLGSTNGLCHGDLPPCLEQEIIHSLCWCVTWAYLSL